MNDNHAACVSINKALTIADVEQQNWMIAGAVAGFLDGQGELANPKAARTSFTGSIHSVLQLLKTSDMLAARQHRALRFQSRSNLITDDH